MGVCQHSITLIFDFLRQARSRLRKKEIGTTTQRNLQKRGSNKRFFLSRTLAVMAYKVIPSIEKGSVLQALSIVRDGENKQRTCAFRQLHPYYKGYMHHENDKRSIRKNNTALTTQRPDAENGAFVLERDARCRYQIYS